MAHQIVFFLLDPGNTLYLGDVAVQLSNQVNIPGQPLRGPNLVVIVDLGY